MSASSHAPAPPVAPVSLAARLGGRVPRPLRLPLALGLATAAFSWLFHPMFYVLDTYDYLFRSVRILAYGHHPFGFGLLLRVLAALSHPFRPRALAYLFTAWQLYCIVVLSRACRDGIPPIRRWRLTIEAAPLVALCMVTVALFLPPMTYLVDGYLSELTSFALMAWTARAFTKAVEAKTSTRRWLLFGALCLIGYHVRYQHLIVLLAAGLALLVWFARRRLSLGELVRHGAILAAIVVTIPLSQRLLAESVVVDQYGLRYHEKFLRESIQCTLGCSVRMFDTTCDSERGRKLLSETPCWQLLSIPEGELGPEYPRSEGVLGTVLSLDATTLLRFLWRAPMRYLTQQQRNPLHIESFHFDSHVRWFSEHVPDVLARYGPYFRRDALAPSPAFEALSTHLENGYSRWWYHWLTAAALYASFIGLLASRDLTAACLYGTTIGTFFLMCYFQPQFPLRYSMHIALPALIAAFRDALGLLARQPSRGASSDARGASPDDAASPHAPEASPDA